MPTHYIIDGFKIEVVDPPDSGIMEKIPGHAWLHYRCNHHDDRYRCELPASHRMFAPDGKPVPGGNYCWAHGDECITEYREKLGEVWTLRALRADGTVQS